MRDNLHISLTNIKNESRIFKESKSLIAYGIFDRIVVVGLHNEPLSESEYLDNEEKIKLERVKIKSRGMPKNAFFRLIKFIEFLTILFFKYGSKKYDTVTVHVLALLPVGVFIKFVYGSRLIYDAHEYETERHQFKGLRKRIAKITEKVMIKYCDKVIVVSVAIANEYKRLYPTLSKPSVVLNVPMYREHQKTNLFREELGISNNANIFLYQGALNFGRGIELVIETFSAIYRNNTCDENSEEVVVVFMGYGELEDHIKKVAKSHPNIYFKSAVPPSQLLEYTASADFGIFMAQNISLSYYYALPNKIFEYIMADLPVLVTNFPEMGKVVKENNIGLIISKNSIVGLKESICSILNKNRDEFTYGLQMVKRKYNWEEQEKILIELYRQDKNIKDALVGNR